MTSGRLFRDATGELTSARGTGARFPEDVWRYPLGSQWQRVAQQEPFVGRTGDVGDNLGSHLVAPSPVADAARLAFPIERRYTPFPE